MAAEVALFISHPWRLRYRVHTQRLIGLLNRAGLKYEITSIRSLLPVQTTSDTYLRRKIRERLSKSDALVFVAGRWVRNSKWMKFEIQEALKLGLPVLAVRRHGTDERTYEETELGIESVGWNSPAIVSRIRQKSADHAEMSRRRMEAMIVERIITPPPVQRRSFIDRLFGRPH